jgi:hypothetical protein
VPLRSAKLVGQANREGQATPERLAHPSLEAC